MSSKNDATSSIEQPQDNDAVTVSDGSDIVEGEDLPEEITEEPDYVEFRTHLRHVGAGAVKVGEIIAAGSIPFFGVFGAGFVAALSFFSSHGQLKKSQRHEDLINHVEKRIDDLDEAKLDKEWLGTEEHEDLLRSAFEASGKARTDEQIELYARILTGAGIKHLREDHDPEAYIELLATLNVQQTKLLRIIWELQEDVDEQGLLAPETSVSKPWRRGQLDETIPVDMHGAVDIALVHLERLGLVMRHYRAPADRETYPVGVPTVTPVCRRLMQFVNADMSTDAVSAPAWKEPASRSIEDRLLFELIRQMEPPSSIIKTEVVRGFTDEEGEMKSPIRALRTLESRDFIELKERNSPFDGDPVDDIAYLKVTPQGLDRYLRVAVESPREVADQLVRAIDEGESLQSLAETKQVPVAAMYRIAQRLRRAGLIELIESTGAVRVFIPKSGAPEKAQIAEVFSR